jgi:hypothetical protein
MLDSLSEACLNALLRWALSPSGSSWKCERHTRQTPSICAPHTLSSVRQSLMLSHCCLCFLDFHFSTLSRWCRLHSICLWFNIKTLTTTNIHLENETGYWGFTSLYFVWFKTDFRSIVFSNLKKKTRNIQNKFKGKVTALRKIVRRCLPVSLILDKVTSVIWSPHTMISHICAIW